MPIYCGIPTNDSYILLQITLYCGGYRLGTTSISLRSLLATDNPLTSPAVLEALFPLSSSTEESHSGSDHDVPAIGVSVVLKHDALNVPPLQEMRPMTENIQPTNNQMVRYNSYRQKEKKQYYVHVEKNTSKMSVE